MSLMRRTLSNTISQLWPGLSFSVSKLRDVLIINIFDIFKFLSYFSYSVSFISVELVIFFSHILTIDNGEWKVVKLKARSNPHSVPIWRASFIRAGWVRPYQTLPFSGLPLVNALLSLPWHRQYFQQKGFHSFSCIRSANYIAGFVFLINYLTRWWAWTAFTRHLNTDFIYFICIL